MTSFFWKNAYLHPSFDGWLMMMMMMIVVDVDDDDDDCGCWWWWWMCVVMMMMIVGDDDDDDDDDDECGWWWWWWWGWRGHGLVMLMNIHSCSFTLTPLMHQSSERNLKITGFSGDAKKRSTALEWRCFFFNTREATCYHQIFSLIHSLFRLLISKVRAT